MTENGFRDWWRLERERLNKERDELRAEWAAWRETLIGVENNVGNLAKDVSNMTSMLENYLSSIENSAILKERQRVANNRINDLEDDNKLLRNDITTIRIKNAATSVIISLVSGAISAGIVAVVVNLIK